MNYFKECIGQEYKSTKYGKHEASHPARVKEALETLKGTKEADVIAALVFEIEILRQRSERFAQRLNIDDDYSAFIADVTLFLQKHSHYNFKLIEPMFQRAYKLYVKYDAENEDMDVAAQPENNVSKHAPSGHTMQPNGSKKRCPNCGSTNLEYDGTCIDC